MGAGPGRRRRRSPSSRPLLRLAVPPRRPALPAPPTSTTSASRSPTSWPRPSAPTTPTTPCGAPSATRGRPTTWPASPNASAARSRRLRLDRGRRHRAADTGHPAGRAGPGARGHRGPRPGHRRGVPAGRVRRTRPAAQRRGGHRRAGHQTGGAGFEGYWRNDRRRAGPAARTAGTGPATWPTATTTASSTSPGGTTTGCGSTARTSPSAPDRADPAAAPRRGRSPRSTRCPTPWWATRSWPRCSSARRGRARPRASSPTSWPPRRTSGPSGRPVSCA